MKIKIKALGIIIIPLLLTFGACDKEDDNSIAENRGIEVFDCTFVQNDEDMDGLLDDWEKDTMGECAENRLTDKSAIEDHIIGEWAIVGHGEGWQSRLSQPCAYLEITENELILDFTSSYRDSISTHNWRIEEIETNVGTSYQLRVEPVFHGLHFSVFCDEYMFMNDMPLDGNMYLYQKVK